MRIRNKKHSSSPSPQSKLHLSRMACWPMMALWPSSADSTWEVATREFPDSADDQWAVGSFSGLDFSGGVLPLPPHFHGRP